MSADRVDAEPAHAELAHADHARAGGLDGTDRPDAAPATGDCARSVHPGSVDPDAVALGVRPAAPRAAIGDAPAPGTFRKLTAEFLGSLLLCAVVIGSGIAAQTLSPGDVGLQLLENALATAMGLAVLILVFAPVSGAHFNPVVSLVDSALGQRPWRETAIYLPAQIAGCISGAVLANAMFGAAAVSISTNARLTGPHFLAEIVATAGLVLVIFSLVRSGRGALAPAAVGAYIGAAYFFTSSTSFANPAITIGRMFSDSFAGIAPGSAPGYIAAQLIGGAIGFALVSFLYPSSRQPDAAAMASSPSEAAAGSAPAARTRH